MLPDRLTKVEAVTERVDQPCIPDLRLLGESETKLSVHDSRLTSSLSWIHLVAGGSAKLGNSPSLDPVLLPGFVERP